MFKFISAVMAAATIAGVLTLLQETSTELDASPLAKPQEATLKACTHRPWPYLNCIGTPLGNPRIRLVTTDRVTPSAGMLMRESVSDARSIQFETSQIKDW
jgi:hypothetical protein